MLEPRIYRDLKKDHDLHRSLLKRIADGETGLFEELRTQITAHAAAEEESLYATILADPDLRDDARHSVAEHKEVADYLAELAKMAPGEGEWDAKFAHMRHRYEHHIDEEEQEMFPAAEKELPDAVEEKLAETYEERKPAELERAVASPDGDERD
ncbi:MAG TPA: hemerythrin domain-containing protein [Allosphingosinicella sp.]|nr:hemerythrin domain-containing protein [Allosphingosinicella sp.]